MIEFVDLKNGQVFNGDAPYIFWFDGGQSVNLNYVRKICFVATERMVKAHIESDTFSLLKMTQNIPALCDPNNPAYIAEVLNEKMYIDLDYLKSADFASYGEPYGGMYIHMIYLLGNSKEAGEIHDTLHLVDSNGDHTYEIAADFYGDNEILKLNLDNFNITIPESIQKAIYDIDVHEDANDNIMLNRKYKELLMNYWDVIANKGSYKSLLNSLAWFEWGDLVRIEEIWKRHGEAVTDYFLTDLNHELDYEFLSEFINNAKTTYIGLYLALSHTVMKDGMIRYQGIEDNPAPRYIGSTVPLIGEEDNPYLDRTVTRWQLLDLCLKMTLLGNFYSTYFTPIHLDTIHSTLEHWVFTYTAKVLHSNSADMWITSNNVRTFDVVYDERVKMTDRVCRNYSDTLFLNLLDSDNPTAARVFGYEDAIRNETVQGFRLSGMVLSGHMGGIYGVVHFRVTGDNPILACDSGDKIIREVLQWRHNGDAGIIESRVPIKPEPMTRTGFRKTQYVLLPSWQLAFEEPGTYTLTFEFETLYGNIWTRTVTVEVEDDTRNRIDIYKVNKIDEGTMYTLEFNPTVWPQADVWLRSFQMTPSVNSPSSYDAGGTRIYTPYLEHDILVEPHMGMDADVNHTVIFNISDQGIVITTNDPGRVVSITGSSLESNLNTQLPEYIWIVNDIPAGAIGYQRVVGIRRCFGTTDTELLITGVDVQGTPTIPLELVIDYRFHPFTHTLEKVEGYMEVTTDDLIYMIPYLGRSKDISVTGWSLENATTQETYDSFLVRKRYHLDDPDNFEIDDKVHCGGMEGWFLAGQRYRREHSPIRPGYYNIKLTYRKGDIPQEYRVKSAMLMKKGDKPQ